jgi:DNA repair protein RadC
LRWPWPWLWRRAAPAAPAIPAPDCAFDASIDLDLSRLDKRDRAAAVTAISTRVRAVPGAGWISVEPHAGAALTVRLFPAGSSNEGNGAAWDTLRRQIELAVQETVAAFPRRTDAGWATPEPVRAGFAEALAPSQFDALQQLAALAQVARPPPVPETPNSAPENSEDVQRLACLLGFVLPADGRAAAASAVRRFGSFAAVLAAPEGELRRVPGLGTHSIAAIKLVHAAAVRLARAGIAGRPVLDEPKRLNDYLAAALGRERIEQFRILFLDEHGMLRADEIQASGTVNHTPVYPREVVRRALALGASSLVLVHNHPSGNPEPSREDIEMTRQVQQAAAVMNIGLRDHVIVGNGRWLSFRDEGFLG